ncbi:hypothetical protein SAMN05421874_1568 [Nonomuraea maritima]|uniref:40-residue YVTN family beta-propeller repeat-containing protein n=1 Tax=Nonomuraea maritima TaxID=683260 RepID=A0A1G9SEG2_9ACTN|nr:WD40 repeat domain-containing protein [Nonomuraea maritima]SDM33730.1 hypothetical protein SAMN05421874_1568 [Nonomuraea maritima]
MRLSPTERPDVNRPARRLISLLGSMTLTAGLVVTAPSAASAADSMTDLGVRLSIADHSEVSAGGDKVFVSAGDRVLITDTEGVLLGAVTDLPGVEELVATPDGVHAYAALSDSHQVVEIDAATMAVTRRIDFTAYSCLTDLALSGQTLWTAHGCDPYAGSVVTRLDVAAPDPQPVTVLTGQGTTPKIAVAGNTLLLNLPDTAPADVAVYDVSTGSATLRGEIDGGDPGTSSQPGLTITPDGSTAVLAFSRGLESWDLASLTKLRDYGQNPAAPGQVIEFAVSPDGDHLAGGWLGDRGVELYDLATGAITYTQKIPSGWPTPRILTMTIVGNGVFSVLYTSGTTNLRLWRLEDAALLPSSVALSAPAEEATALEPVKLTGRLTLPEGMNPGLRALKVTRRLPDGTSTQLPYAKTKLDGSFSITDTPPKAGTVSYDASWPGSATVRGSTASASVAVARQSSSLTLHGNTEQIVGNRLYLWGTLKFGDHAPTTSPSLTVIRANPDGTSTELGTTQVAASGGFKIGDTPDQEGEYLYSVVFLGDDTAEGTIEAHSVTVRAGD